MVQKQTSTEQAQKKATREDLFAYVSSLSEEQINKLINNIELLKVVAGMTEPQATYTKELTTRLFAL